MTTNTGSMSAEIAAKVWGHRFMDGQRGPEYVLEFLNVLVGAKYKLGASEYQRKKAEFFRKFIFEGDKEGSKNDIVTLPEEKREELYRTLEDEDKVMVIREFFRNLEVPLYDGRGKAANRSWYAKSLYPLHESLLFFEVRKNKDSISYERNFFARGGELYYLMLSYGTENNLSLREKISNRFLELLQKNKSIENIVSKINEALGDTELENNNDAAPLENIPESKKEYPVLPIQEHYLFEQFSKEIYELISLDIDIYEVFHWLINLITFQLSRYMYDRVKIDESEKILLFFDCLDGQYDQVLKLSAKTFHENEMCIRTKFEIELEQNFDDLLSSKENLEDEIKAWKENIDSLLDTFQLKNLKGRRKRIEKAMYSCNSREDLKNKLFPTIKEVVLDQLKQHQFSIVRGIVRDGGMGGFRSGTKYRYFMTDKFLQMLVLINVSAKCPMEFSCFLELLYEKYGFVIGEREAKNSGIYKRSKLNINYFQQNEYALREKLKSNGLLVEYSDATAMIRNPYETVEERLISC